MDMMQAAKRMKMAFGARYAVTFGETAILHVGGKAATFIPHRTHCIRSLDVALQELGDGPRDEGFTVKELRQIAVRIQEAGGDATVVSLSSALPSELQTPEHEAATLVIRGGASFLTGATTTESGSRKRCRECECVAECVTEPAAVDPGATEADPTYCGECGHRDSSHEVEAVPPVEDEAAQPQAAAEEEEGLGLGNIAVRATSRGRSVIGGRAASPFERGVQDAPLTKTSMYAHTHARKVPEQRQIITQDDETRKLLTIITLTITTYNSRVHVYRMPAVQNMRTHATATRGDGEESPLICSTLSA